MKRSKPAPTDEWSSIQDMGFLSSCLTAATIKSSDGRPVILHTIDGNTLRVPAKRRALVTLNEDGKITSARLMRRGE